MVALTKTVVKTVINFFERKSMLKKAQNPSLEILINNTASWASNWNEVLLYLRGPGLKNPRFSVSDVIELIDDIRNLRDENFPYTTNVERIRERIR